MQRERSQTRAIRHRRIRAKVAGVAARPRLVVFRSLLHIYAQVIDDVAGRTLAAASDMGLKIVAKDGVSKSMAAAQAVGAAIAEKAKAAGITAVVFDRGGYQYHGRVKALADAARAGGLEF